MLPEVVDMAFMGPGSPPPPAAPPADTGIFSSPQPDSKFGLPDLGPEDLNRIATGGNLVAKQDPHPGEVQQGPQSLADVVEAQQAPQEPSTPLLDETAEMPEGYRESYVHKFLDRMGEDDVTWEQTLKEFDLDGDGEFSDSEQWAIWNKAKGIAEGKGLDFNRVVEEEVGPAPRDPNSPYSSPAEMYENEDFTAPPVSSDPPASPWREYVDTLSDHADAVMNSPLASAMEHFNIPADSTGMRSPGEWEKQGLMIAHQFGVGSPQWNTWMSWGSIPARKQFVENYGFRDGRGVRVHFDEKYGIKGASGLGASAINGHNRDFGGMTGQQADGFESGRHQSPVPQWFMDRAEIGANARGIRSSARAQVENNPYDKAHRDRYASHGKTYAAEQRADRMQENAPKHRKQSESTPYMPTGGSARMSQQEIDRTVQRDYDQHRRDTGTEPNEHDVFMKNLNRHLDKKYPKEPGVTDPVTGDTTYVRRNPDGTWSQVTVDRNGQAVSSKQAQRGRTPDATNPNYWRPNLGQRDDGSFITPEPFPTMPATIPQGQDRAAVAQAVLESQRNWLKDYGKYDTNRDGVISDEEMITAFPPPPDVQAAMDYRKKKKKIYGPRKSGRRS